MKYTYYTKQAIYRIGISFCLFLVVASQLQAQRTNDFDSLMAAGNNNPAGIWSNDTTMWVADDGDDKIFAYNLATKSRDTAKDFNTLSAAGNTSPTGIWSDGSTMWVADPNNNKIFAYNLADKMRDTAKDFNTLNAAGNTRPQGIWSDGNTMWVADISDFKIYAYNLADKSRDAAKDFNTLVAGNFSPIGIWSDRSTMWVADNTLHLVKIFAYNLADKSYDMDKDFNTLVSVGNVDPTGIWSNGSTMWVADFDDVKIYAYNSSSDLVPSVSLAPSVVSGGTSGNTTLNVSLTSSIINTPLDMDTSTLATTFRVYRSVDATIDTMDMQIGSAANVPPVLRDSIHTAAIEIDIPALAGTYYYGVCVAAFTGESVTNNNCVGDSLMVTNTAPTVATPPLGDVAITAGDGFDAINLGPFFSDPNGDELMYVATSNDTMVVKTTITDSTLTLTEVAIGMAIVIVTASDGDLSVADTFAVSINAAPTVANELTDVAITAGDGFDAINLGPFFSDPNGDELMYVATSNDTMVVKTTITDSTLTLTEVAAGMATVIVTASDGDLSVADTFAVSINAAPTVANELTDVVITAGDGFDAINLGPFFSDPNGDELMYVATSSNTMVVKTTITDSTLTLTEVAAGMATITVTASDPANLSVVDSFMVTIINNRAPVRTEVPLVIPPTVEVGFQLPTPIDLSPFFTDPDEDDLMFTVASSDIAVATVSIVETSKLTFTAVAAGTATLTVTVADPDGLSVKDSLMITVTEKAKEPLGIAETDILAVYPNPSTGIFQLSKKADVVRVYDMSGRLIYRGRKVEQLDLTNNVAGQYVVEVRVGKEKGRYTIIKE